MAVALGTLALAGPLVGPVRATPFLLVVNTPPVGVLDTFTTPFQTELVVAAPGVLANDLDLDGDPLFARPRSSPAHGTLSLLSTGGLRYLPDSGFSGRDSFTYAADDGSLSSLPTVVTIVVGSAPPSTPPPPTPAPTASPVPPSALPTLPPPGPTLPPQTFAPSAMPTVIPSTSWPLPATPDPSPIEPVVGETSGTPSAAPAGTPDEPRASRPAAGIAGGSGTGGPGGVGPSEAASALTVWSPADRGVNLEISAIDLRLEWIVPTAAITIPGLAIILVALLGQWVGGLAWVPLVRRSLAGDGRRGARERAAFGRDHAIRRATLSGIRPGAGPAGRA